MGYRNLDVTIISAEGLNDVNLMSKMDVYVTASIAGVRKLTHVDKRGGTSPKWNHHMRFSIAETAANQPHLCLLFTLRSDRLLGDKDIGYVSVPLRDLVAGTAAAATEHVVEYLVQKPSGGKPKGAFKFSYRFDGNFAPPYSHPGAAALKKEQEPVTAYPPYGGGSAVAPPYAEPFNAGTAAPSYSDPFNSGTAAAKKDQEPVTAYPPCSAGPAKGQEAMTAYPPNIGAGTTGAPPAGVAMAYNPPPPAYAYPPPQAAAGYGYAAPPQAYPAGYGYAQPQVQKTKKKKNKMGFGTGLLGGLLLGEMLSDTGDMTSYDAGYDGGGFDFDF